MPVVMCNDDLLEEDELEGDEFEENEDEEPGRRKRKRARLSSSLKKATRRRQRGYMIIFNYIQLYS